MFSKQSQPLPNEQPKTQDADVQKCVKAAVAAFLLAKGAAIIIRWARELSNKPIVLKLDSGHEVHLLRTGAAVVGLFTPDRRGAIDDIVLGHASTLDYRVDKAGTYFGCVVGRVANRIADAQFPLPGGAAGAVCKLEANDAPHALHGGSAHWGRQPWAATVLDPAEGGPGVRFSRTSPAHEAGYPGQVAATVTYRLQASAGGGAALVCVMEADTLEATPINMVQHSYFNLAGHKRVKEGVLITEHTMEIQGRFVTPTRPDLIPTGNLLAVAGTPFDFSAPAFIGERMHAHGAGFDHNWVLHADSLEAARRMCTEPGGMMKATQRAAEMYEPTSGRGMILETNAPGLQFYTGNFLNNNRGKGGARYKQHAGFCVETQTFPNSVNTAQFPSPMLYPGQHYRHEMVMRFFTN